MPTKKTTKKATKKVAKKAAKKTTRTTTKKATKKITKSAPSKKAATSSSSKKTTKKATKKSLRAAAPEKAFWVSDGQVLSSLLDLEAAFGSMADTVFVHHANKEKNDFADWVEHVLNDHDCASALRSCRKPRTAKSVVVRHLKLYQA